MFKLSLAAVIGLTAALSAASADPIPLPAPDHIPAPSIHGFGFSAYDTASFARLGAMCARMGFDCTAPRAARPGSHPEADTRYGDPRSDAARADAEKHLALYAEAWEHFAAAPPAWLPMIPAPRLSSRSNLFGYTAPRAAPYTAITPYQFGHHAPSAPRITGPYGYPFPRGAFSLGAVSPLSIRNNPVFPWPFL